MRLLCKKVFTPEEAKLQAEVKTGLGAQIRENYKTLPTMEEPRIFANVVYHENILGPITKEYEITTIFTQYHRVPISISKPEERQNMEGKRCLHYDLHLNT